MDKFKEAHEKFKLSQEAIMDWWIEYELPELEGRIITGIAKGEITFTSTIEGLWGAGRQTLLRYLKERKSLANNFEIRVKAEYGHPRNTRVILEFVEQRGK